MKGQTDGRILRYQILIIKHSIGRVVLVMLDREWEERGGEGVCLTATDKNNHGSGNGATWLPSCF